jgi:hypothetical protein
MPNLHHAKLVIPMAIALGVAGVWMANPLASLTETLPAGETITVQLTDTVASNQDNPGDQFHGTLAEAILVNGKLAVPKGTQIKGKVVDARGSKSLKRAARLRLTLSSIQLGRKTYELHTTDVARYGRGGRTGVLQRHAAAVTSSRNITIPAETTLHFKLIEPLRLSVRG